MTAPGDGDGDRDRSPDGAPPAAPVVYPVQARPGRRLRQRSRPLAGAGRAARTLLAELRAEPGMPLAIASGLLVGIALAVLLFGR